MIQPDKEEKVVLEIREEGQDQGEEGEDRRYWRLKSKGIT